MPKPSPTILLFCCWLFVNLIKRHPCVISYEIICSLSSAPVSKCYNAMDLLYIFCLHIYTYAQLCGYVLCVCISIIYLSKILYLTWTNLLVYFSCWENHSLQWTLYGFVLRQGLMDIRLDFKCCVTKDEHFLCLPLTALCNILTVDMFSSLCWKSSVYC